MRIIINIKNSTAKAKDIILLNGIMGSTKLPKGISSIVNYIDDKNEDKMNTITYSRLIKQLDHIPYCVKIYHTSNNRQISFFTHTMQSLMYRYLYNGKPYQPLVPRLTKNGAKIKYRFSAKHNCDIPSPEWDSKEWNIADTKELFILDNKILFELNIKPKQKFRIIIDTEPLININPFGKSSESIYVLEDIQKYLNLPKLKKTKNK